MSERPKLAAIVPAPNNIPIIDLSKLSEGDRDGIMQLKTACEEWGFFQVVSRGIGPSVVENITNVAKDFIKLPLEEKEKYPMAPGNQKLDWCNMFALGVEPPCIRNLKLWPLKPAHFGETLEVYSREIRKLCKDLLWYIAVSLGLKGDVFEEMFGVAVQAVRMNYYPPCSRPDLVLGLSPHSDGSAITVLQQGKGSSVGLQILKDRKWVSVQPIPIPNALVINIGDTIEVPTNYNGRYKSVEHRAVTQMEQDRLSIVTFYSPRYEVELGRYNHGDYTKHYVSDKLQDKRTLEFAKMEPEIST
ncbi:hypothetical protein GQ457_16G031030 [Hibiscus cannabinus]